MRANMKKVKDAGALNTPCTITEAVQIARGVSEDVVADYQRRHAPVQVSMSIQLEMLKSALFKAGIMSEEEFRDEYIKQVEMFNEKQRESMNEIPQEEENTSKVEDTPKMETVAGDIEIKRS